MLGIRALIDSLTMQVPAQTTITAKVMVNVIVWITAAMITDVVQVRFTLLLTDQTIWVRVLIITVVTLKVVMV